MIDRDKVVNVLKKRFPGAPEHQVAAAANAIVGLGDEWEEMKGVETELGGNVPFQPGKLPFLTDEVEHGAEFRVFRKRESVSIR